MRLSSGQMRVTFDRSAFHGDNFDLLKRSPLRKLVVSNRLRVLFTQDFFDETLATRRSKRVSDDWREHFNFALDLCDGRVFLPQEEIWRSELVAGRGRHARYLRRLRPSLIDWLRQDLVSDNHISEIMRRGEPLETEIQRRKDHWKVTSRVVREELAQWAKKHHVTAETTRNYPFSELSKRGLREIGGMLMGMVDADHSEQLTDAWARSPESFPFYSASVEGILYSLYYAMIEQNRPIDRNAIADAGQLSYLVWTDIVVSNDNKFFRSAFETLWKPRGKRMESTASFVKLLEATA